MSSKQTGNDQKKIALEDYLPEPTGRKATASEPAHKEMKKESAEPDDEKASGQPTIAVSWSINDSIATDDTAQPENGIGSANSMQTKPTVPPEQSEQPEDIPANAGSRQTRPSVQREDNEDCADSLQSGPPASPTATSQTASRRTGSRQRKESLEEYRQTFLMVPKLEDRKPVFVSREVRDRLDEIARKLGGRRMSVSGFIENLARHHLATYHEDIEVWRKL